MKEEEIEFSIPDNFIEQLYEFSGGVDKYKGLILAVCTENGSPTIYSKYDSSVVELGLKKSVHDFASSDVDIVPKNK